MWERKIILRTGLVEISEVNTDSHFAMIFGNMDDVGQPLGVLDHRWKSYTKLLLNLFLDLQAPTRVQSSQLLLNWSGMGQKWQMMLDDRWIKDRHVLIRPCENVQI